MVFIEKPIWVDDEPLILSLLTRLIDKLDKQQTRIVIKVSPKHTPELFDFNNNDCAYLWSLIEELETTYNLISISNKNKLSTEEQYIGAVLRFDLSKEIILRYWMNRPVQKKYLEVWEEACSKVADGFKGNISKLREAKISHPIKSAEEIIQCFVYFSNYLSNPNAKKNTLRAFSAHFFWGDSKFLDGKHELVCGIFSEHLDKIITKKLLINISLPMKLEQVLFIENQDTFLQLSDCQSRSEFLNNTALIYSAGFKGSASRIRDLGRAVFSVIEGNYSNSVEKEFMNWWFGSDEFLDCYFWGDFDFSGFAILSSIKKIFPNLAVWMPAYSLMEQMLIEGLGHSPEETTKLEQRDPIQTGCEYSDTVLIPLLRKLNQFLDQEAVFIDKLLKV